MKITRKICFQLLAGLSLLTFNSYAFEHNYIVTGKDLFQSTQSLHSNLQIDIIKVEKDLVIAKTKIMSEQAEISHLAHEEHQRCGGFFAFQTKEEALQFVKEQKENSNINAFLADYTINQEDLVRSAIANTKESSIRSVIEKLSSFNNRYYKSQTGVDSQQWLKDHWTSLTSHRSDISVDFFNHSSYPQPSVIATIKGKTDDVIVIGGHGDSIAGWWGRTNAHAPGADDNASGVATVTEVLKTLAQSGYQPEKTIMFISYAAEEVGLLGSKEIAQTFKRQGKNVVGVMQLDMTNFNGSNDDITIITDYTNEAQNNFLGSLLDKYLPELSWGRDTCGYACSDHASWTAQGFPASTPFETRKREMNGKIHSSRDTLDNMGGTADHALKFAKLALAFTIELDR
ncbi:M20/M25/M40 family metallo-hydrolase [Halobacteriovorax sp. ZH4_bin.1]|uniref:M20/M25/M40 family metallo-hydrolase n=1 Tax=unclassified Halobacteriovorax TaxID=2639665 RepID=UPI00371BCE40